MTSRRHARTTYLGNTLMRWIIAAGIIVGVYIVLLLLRRLVRRIPQLAATPQAELLEVPLKIASQHHRRFPCSSPLLARNADAGLPERASRALLTLFTISRSGSSVCGRRGRARFGRAQAPVALEHDRAAAGSLGIIGFLSRVTIWSFVLLLTLDNLGIEIKPLLAGFGIGGIAVALPPRTCSAICSRRCRSRSIGRSSWAMRWQWTTSAARSSTSASRARACAASTASRSSFRTRTC